MESVRAWLKPRPQNPPRPSGLRPATVAQSDGDGKSSKGRHGLSDLAEAVRARR